MKTYPLCHLKVILVKIKYYYYLIMIVRLPKSLRKNLCCSLCGKTHSTNETVTITNNTSTTTSTNNSTTTSTTIN